MVQAGFSREFARQFILDAGKAYRSVLDTSSRLAKHFKDVQFVLRPHPFESIASYDALAELPNFHVRQDGTSLEWISGARLLVHQNCSTAIEATMLNVEPLSMEWFNTPSLRLDAATQVSRGAGSESDLIDLVQQGLIGRLPPVSPEIEQFRQRIIGDLFTAVDGANSSRVTEAVLDAITAARGGKRGASTLPQPSLRGVAAEAIRRVLGYKASTALRRSYSAPENERRRLGKAFAPDMVNPVLQRICAASGDGRKFLAQRVTGHTRRISRTLSGASLQLTEAV